MNRSELISKISEDAGLSKVDATKALDSFINAVGDVVSGGDTLTLVGFGTFSTKARGERKGRNPRTGEEITIAPSTIPVFKPGKALKDLANK